MIFVPISISATNSKLGCNVSDVDSPHANQVHGDVDAVQSHDAQHNSVFIGDVIVESDHQDIQVPALSIGAYIENHVEPNFADTGVHYNEAKPRTQDRQSKQKHDCKFRRRPPDNFDHAKSDLSRPPDALEVQAQ